MSVSMKSHLDMFCDSYFNDTPPSDWSYLSFLETLKPVFMSTDQDVSLSENSALRKRYRNVLKRIVSEKRDNEQVKVATSLLQKDETHGIKEFWENINLDKKVARERITFKKESRLDALKVLGSARANEADGATDEFNIEMEQRKIQKRKKQETNLNDEIDNFFQSNPEQKSATEENDDSGFFSLGSQPISFCNASDTEGLADGSKNKPFLVSEEEYAYLQEILNEGVKFQTPNKRGNEIEEDVSTRKKAKKTIKSTCSVEHPQSRNSEKSSSDFSSSGGSDEVPDDDEEIKFDLVDISIELEQEPTCKWEVGCINVTDRFRQYQKEVIKRAEREGLKYDNIYELLALSSIMVLCWPCPYPHVYETRVEGNNKRQSIRFKRTSTFA
ncbi:unnamed protein product [Rhizophagus irregularis]|nr:unnamed protein product [Rhizophagus irregularis]